MEKTGGGCGGPCGRQQPCSGPENSSRTPWYAAIHYEQEDHYCPHAVCTYVHSLLARQMTDRDYSYSFNMTSAGLGRTVIENVGAELYGK